MIFWAIIGGLSILTGLWLALPYLRTRSVEMSGSDSAISIYRDQLDELARDREAGLISEAECEAARQEVERRTIQAARRLDGGFLSSKRSIASAGVLTVLSGAAAIGIYAALGTPERPDQPLAARKTETLMRRAEAGDIKSRIQLLIDRTSEAPDSFEAWWMLARSYASVGDHASSADAYRHAANLAGDRPAVLSAYAEAMTLANGNKVPAAARVIFEQLAMDHADPRARYYAALAKAQSQNFLGAIEEWAALARDSSSNAPWMPLVRRDIVNMARFLNTDVTAYLPDADEDEIATSLGQVSKESTISVAELEATLEADPKDYKGWIALAQARAGEGNTEGAVDALASARGHFAAAPFILDLIAQTERSLGLDLVAEQTRRGPTSEDIAAAADMTQDERDGMIEGMVAGLAARLEAEPNDPDGWVMLVRSYATLGDFDKAREAYQQAAATFQDDDRVLQAIRSQTSDFVASD